MNIADMDSFTGRFPGVDADVFYDAVRWNARNLDLDEIEELVLSQQGMEDGDPWVWVVTIGGDRVVVTGWCDHHGWECDGSSVDVQTAVKSNPDPWETSEGQELLLDIAGPVGLREFNRAEDWGKGYVWPNLLSLRTMTDREFVDVVQGWICDSAFWSNARGNHEHVHALASAAYHESNRRQMATRSSLIVDSYGSPRCSRHSLYARAHRQAMSDNGYRQPIPECICKES